ncbi:MAG: segregation/condensation protein A, partial [Oscillospiraceae bacterium]|nr:segregation/condensation protein A [Oscillospiraceae bacterium]
FVSVTAKIFTLLRKLRKYGHIPISELFGTEPERSGMIASFLALLELVKTGRVLIDGQAVRLTGKKAA